MFLVRYSPATAMFNGGMQSVMKRYLICFIFILTLSISSTALGSQPMDEIRDPMDKIIQILRDPQYQSASQKAAQRQKIWLIVDNFFDFKEISQRTLARFWKNFTPGQQQAFVDVFSEFLANIYLKRIQGAYKNETVVFIGQNLLSETKASVKTKVIREGGIEIPVDYSLLKRDNAWKVYDVAIEGVSLVKNYRTQFRGILLKQEPARLIEILKKKNEKNKSKTSSAAGECLDMRFMAQRCLLAVWFNRYLAEARIK